MFKLDDNVMVRAVARFATDDDGADLIEYAVVAALIVGIAVTVFGFLRTGLSTAFHDIVNEITKATGGT